METNKVDYPRAVGPPGRGQLVQRRMVNYQLFVVLINCWLFDMLCWEYHLHIGLPACKP